MHALRKAVVTATVLSALGAGAAQAAGPGGHSETNNQANCTSRSGTGVWQGTGTTEVYAGTGGVSVCNISRTGFQGRVMVSTEGWAAVDGDADNSPDEADGYVRVDGDGVHCGNAANQDAAAEDQSANSC